MNRQSKSNRWIYRLPIFLALLLPIFLAVPAAAQNPATLTIGPNDAFVEITGGAVGHAWKLHYGSFNFSFPPFYDNKPLLVNADNNRAWFSHGGWLRLIDTNKGQVIGRWHITDLITALTPKGDSVEVRYFLDSGIRTKINRAVTISPDTKAFAFTNPDNFYIARVPRMEIERPSEFGFFTVVAPQFDKREEHDRKLLPEFEELARRDPLSPLIQAAYGSVLKNSGDPRAAAVLRSAISIDSSDYTELLYLSSYFDLINEPTRAHDAFERGYRDYLERGNDPRLFFVLISRLMIYPGRYDNRQLSPSSRDQALTHLYRLAPNMESAYLAWQLYADDLRSHGDVAGAHLWQQRADSSKRADLFHWFAGQVDWYLVIFLGSVGAWLSFFVIQWMRYAPQRTVDYAKSPKPSTFGYVIRFTSVPYWSFRERWTAVAIVFISWYSFGLISVFLAGASHLFQSSINAGTGNIGVPQAVKQFEGYPETAGRNFLLAFGYQQNGDNEKALRIYMGQPQYAEAWNNLGVIYRQNGDEKKSREAFESALRINPDLQVAKLNLGQPTSGQDLFVEQHRQLFPGLPMLASPKPEMFHEALMGSSGLTPYLQAFAGPLLGGYSTFNKLFGGISPAALFVWWQSMVFVLVLSAVFFVPHCEVSQPPPRWLDWIELFIPGASRQWGWLTAPTLTALGSIVYASIATGKLGTPFLVTFIAIPNIPRAWPVPGTMQDVNRLLLPHWSVLYGLPIALFVINAVLVLRGRFHGRAMPPELQARSAASSSVGPRG